MQQSSVALFVLTPAGQVDQLFLFFKSFSILFCTPVKLLFIVSEIHISHVFIKGRVLHEYKMPLAYYR